MKGIGNRYIISLLKGIVVCLLVPAMAAAAEPDLIVTGINSYHNNLGCPAWFNLSNEVDVTVKNDGTAAAGASNVCLYIDDVFIGKLPVAGLGAGASATVTFENWKPTGEDCLQEPCVFEWSYMDYNFTAVADCDNDVAESDEGNNEITIVDRACYNGYMGDEPLENVAHGMLHGGVLFTTGDGSYGGVYFPGATRNTNYDITLPDGATVELAQLNVYYTWTKPEHVCPEMEVRITNATGTYVVPLEKAYNDIKCTCPGASWIQSWGNYVFDVTDYITGNGTCTVTVENVGPIGHSFCITAPGIALVYEDQNASLVEYWINTGADVLMGGRRYTYTVNLAWWECINNATFQASTETDDVMSATLGVVAPWGDSYPNDILFFNEIELGSGVYNGYSNPYSETIDGITMHIGGNYAQVGAGVVDVTFDYLKERDNIVGQADDGDNIMACNAFLVVEYPQPDLEIIDIWTESDDNSFDTIIHYTITNNGGAEASSRKSGLTVDGVAVNKPNKVDELAPGQTSYEFFNYRGVPQSSIMVCADCNNRVEESNEANNCLLVAV